MERMCLLLLLLGFAATAGAQAIVFPGQADYAEGDPCLTRSGVSGTCSRSCGHSPSFEEPPKCGITDPSLVCCDTPLDVSPENLDVSPPSVTFDCSVSRPQVISSERPTSINKAQGHLASGGEIPVVGVSSGHTTWPWMALIGRRRTEGPTWHCTGMLINEEWVLSYAGCFFDEQPRVVRLGEYDFNDDFDGAAHQDFNVAKTVFHPDFLHSQAYHDLILVKLDSSLTFQKYISPVCLPWGMESRNNITGQKAMLLTYGNEFGGSLNSAQKEIEVTVFPVAQCDRSYSTLLQYTINWPRGMGQETLCAGDPAGGRDDCVGDSGGPLVTRDARGRYVAAGIVSRGYGCGHKDYPGLYVNLRYPPHLAWIKKVAFATP